MKRYKKLIILFGLMAFAGLAFFWYRSQSIIQVAVSGPHSGEITYTFMGEPSQKSISLKTGDTNVSKRLPSGIYGVLVTNDERSYFSEVKTGRFFAKTSINARLAAESYRTLVGNNPDTCVFYGIELYSYACGGTSTTINRHVPATDSLPTYKETVSIPGTEGILEGLFKTAEGTILVVRLTDVEGSAGHVAFAVDDNLKPQGSSELRGLDNSKTYTVVNYKKGFLAYASDFSELFYYDNARSSPAKLKKPKPSDQSLKPVSLHINNDTISYFYSSLTNTENQKPEDNKNEVIVSSGGQEKSYVFNGQASQAFACGDSLVCINEDGQVRIENVDSRAVSYYFSDIKTAHLDGDNLLLANDKYLLAVNPASAKGHIVYSLGSYGLCGVHVLEPGKYLLCASGSDGRVALTVERGRENQDSIDKKIQALRQTPYITNISAYGRYIYITPELGPLVYDPAEKIYKNNPKAAEKAHAQIDKRVGELGFGTLGYKINIIE